MTRFVTLRHASRGYRGGVGGDGIGGLQLVTYLTGQIEQAEELEGSLVQTGTLVGTLTYTEQLEGVLDE